MAAREEIAREIAAVTESDVELSENKALCAAKKKERDNETRIVEIEAVINSVEVLTDLDE